MTFMPFYMLSVTNIHDFRYSQHDAVVYRAHTNVFVYILLFIQCYHKKANRYQFKMMFACFEHLYKNTQYLHARSSYVYTAYSKVNTNMENSL